MWEFVRSNNWYLSIKRSLQAWPNSGGRGQVNLKKPFPTLGDQLFTRKMSDEADKGEAGWYSRNVVFPACCQGQNPGSCSPLGVRRTPRVAIRIQLN